MGGRRGGFGGRGQKKKTARHEKYYAKDVEEWCWEAVIVVGGRMIECECECVYVLNE